LQQAPFVMTLFRPGIGKKEVHPGQRSRPKHVAQHLDRVVLDDAQIVQTQFGNQFAQAADARRMHFDAEVVVLRVRRGNRRRGLAHAETDFDNPRRRTPEQRVEIDPRRAVGNADADHHLFVIALLGIRDPPLATHETADVPGATGSVHGLLASHAYEPIKPVVGEEGSAE
jgi:hypothetical protein